VSWCPELVRVRIIRSSQRSVSLREADRLVGRQWEATHCTSAGCREREPPWRVVERKVRNVAYPRRLGRDDVATAVPLYVREMSGWFEVTVMKMHPAQPKPLLDRWETQ
jgi:hypothetical protein